MALHSLKNVRSQAIWAARKPDYVCFHDDKPSAESPIADLIKHYPIKAMNVIAHIRKATQGSNNLANTHPVREVGGAVGVCA